VSAPVATSCVRLLCSGCGAPLAFTTGDTDKRSKIYCSVLCMLDYSNDPQEERNATWRAMYERGISPVRIGQVYGVHHSLVYRVLKRR
jgi:hypothetical protein